MSPLHATDADRRRQAHTARILEAAWGVELHEFAPLCPIDWFSINNGSVTGVFELKCRSNAHDRYPTVLLAVRKWLALLFAQHGLGVEAAFVARFTDEIRWIGIGMHMGELVLAGTDNGIIGREGKEPCIEVPIENMRVVPIPPPF